MNEIKQKLLAIGRILKSHHFVLITSDKKLTCKEIKSTNTNEIIASKMYGLYWDLVYGSIYRRCKMLEK